MPAALTSTSRPPSESIDPALGRRTPPAGRPSPLLRPSARHRPPRLTTDRHRRPRAGRRRPAPGPPRPAAPVRGTPLRHPSAYGPLRGRPPGIPEPAASCRAPVRVTARSSRAAIDHSSERARNRCDIHGPDRTSGRLAGNFPAGRSGGTTRCSNRFDTAVDRRGAGMQSEGHTSFPREASWTRSILCPQRPRYSWPDGESPHHPHRRRPCSTSPC